MNIALEDTKEFVEGKMRRNYGDAFVRGNNGVFFLVLGLVFSLRKGGLWGHTRLMMFLLLTRSSSF